MGKNKNYIDLAFKESTTANKMFCQFDDQHGVLLLDVKNSFTSEDFEVISKIIDDYFDERGELKGLIINSNKFPYWKGANNRAQYIKFASENHYKFSKVAFCIGGFFIKIIVRFGRGRVSPQLKIFGYNRIQKAQNWILKDHGFVALD